MKIPHQQNCIETAEEKDLNENKKAGISKGYTT